MRAGFPRALREQLAPLEAQCPVGVLASLGRVFLEESPHCRLPEQRADAFQGAGGSASRATVHIAGLYALLAHRLQDLAVTDGRAADPGHAAAVVPHWRAGALVIRDVGSWRVEVLGQVAAKQACFLSRFSNRVAG
jgi:hypothetical protein